MPLVNLRKILAPAREGRYGVAAYDIVNTEYAAAIVRAAEEARSPVVLMIYEAYFRYFDIDLTVPALVRLAKRSSVPVAVHLDHGTSWETAVHAVEAGCSSVMLDCSSACYDDNAAVTKRVVDLCHPRGISVESEIGCVGGDESIASLSLADGCVADEGLYTNVEEASRFVEATGVDALAVAVGNVHGPYKGIPCLDLPRLSEIDRRTGIPLVLHGGSGLSDDDFRAAIGQGICKINVNTSLILAAAQTLKGKFDDNPRNFNFPELLLSSYDAVSTEARRLMDVFGCTGRVR